MNSGRISVFQKHLKISNLEKCDRFYEFLWTTQKETEFKGRSTGTYVSVYE